MTQRRLLLNVRRFLRTEPRCEISVRTGTLLRGLFVVAKMSPNRYKFAASLPVVWPASPFLTTPEEPYVSFRTVSNHGCLKDNYRLGGGGALLLPSVQTASGISVRPGKQPGAWEESPRPTPTPGPAPQSLPSAGFGEPSPTDPFGRTHGRWHGRDHFLNLSSPVQVSRLPGPESERLEGKIKTENDLSAVIGERLANEFAFLSDGGFVPPEQAVRVRERR